MKEAYIVLPGDISRLPPVARHKPVTDSLLCSRMSEVADLKEAANVYFVISELAMMSTAYQELVFSALTGTENAKHWLLFLDDVHIPAGLKVLRSLPRIAI